VAFCARRKGHEDVEREGERRGGKGILTRRGQGGLIKVSYREGSPQGSNPNPLIS